LPRRARIETAPLESGSTESSGSVPSRVFCWMNRELDHVQRFDGALVVLLRHGRGLSVFNATAGWIIETILANGSPDATAEVLANRHSLALQVARRDVAAVIRALRSALHTTKGAESGAPIESISASGEAHEIRIEVGGYHLACAFSGPRALRERLQVLLEHWRASSTEGKVSGHLEVRSVDGEYKILVDGCEIIRTRDSGELVGGVYQQVLRYLHPSLDPLCVAHAAAIAIGDTGVLLPAPSGSGKSTLAAHMVARGHGYLGDDWIPVDADGRIRGFHTRLGAKEGSWPLLVGDYPELAAQPVVQVGAKRVRYLPLQSHDVGPVPIACVIFPHYEAGVGTTLRRIAPLDALLRLISDRIWVGSEVSPTALDRFLSWLEGMPCAELRYSELPDAAGAIEEHIQHASLG
jgi:hypothetical protein